MEDINLKTVRETLQELELKHFLACGTLLGLIREGDFLSWDKDLDFALFSPEAKEISSIQRSLR